MDIRKLGILFAVAALLASCATQPVHAASSAPGFLLGIWHGFIAVFSLIGSLFWDVRIYAFPNSGFWYDAGFMLGLSVWGTAFGSSRNHHH